MPPNYNPVQNDAIELLTPGDHHLELGGGAGAAGQQKRLGRHTRSASSSSFIHYKAPQQKEEVIPSGNKLASQVNELTFFFSWRRLGCILKHYNRRYHRY